MGNDVIGSTFAIRRMMKKMMMKKVVPNRPYWTIRRVNQVHPTFMIDGDVAHYKAFMLVAGKKL